MALLLNCDLGENATNGEHSSDALVMPHIDLANIACGMHAGDENTMRRTLALAARHDVRVGAHPGYADRANFGRISIPHSREELLTLLHSQIDNLQALALAQDLNVEYIKPHGALYNDMMANDDIRQAVMSALASHESVKTLMLLATGNADKHREEAEKHGISLLFDTFADRCYHDSGHLVPRSEPGAVHDREHTLAQVQQLHTDGSVTTTSGRRLRLQADTLCVHGDNPEAVAAIRHIRQLLSQGR